MTKTWEKSQINTLARNLEKRSVRLYRLWRELSTSEAWPHSYGSTARKVRHLIQEGRIHPKTDINTGKIGYLDIETTHLKANFGHLLSWAIKERDSGKTHCKWASREELTNSDTPDRRIMLDLVKTLPLFDTVITFYGDGFDWPFVRTRALKHGIWFPEYGFLQTIDLYFTARSKLCLHSKSLASICEFLEIPGKTPVPASVWQRAGRGNPEAMKYVVKHNIADVRITELAHKKLEPYTKGISKSV